MGVSINGHQDIYRHNYERCESAIVFSLTQGKYLSKPQLGFMSGPLVETLSESGSLDHFVPYHRKY